MTEIKELEKFFEDHPENLLIVNNLMVWFPIKRGIGEIFRRKPQRYVKAVDNVSFNIKKEETFCLVGESGCGKTTTGKSLLRLVPITSGVGLFRPSDITIERLKKEGIKVNNGYVNIYGLPPKKVKPIRKDIQMIYQDPFGSLNPRYKIMDILTEPLKIHNIGLSEEEERELVYKTLEKVKLKPPEDFADRHPHQLSGGQRQRIAIAKAMIMGPRLIVADEPVSMLDVSIRAEVLELLMNFKNENKLSYLFITHDLAVARYICDRIAVMYLGKIVEMGKARNIIEQPMHPYTRALVAAIPEPDPSNRLKVRKLFIKGEVQSAANIPSGCRFHPRCMAYDENKPILGDICEKEDPGYYITEDGRLVSCWLYKNLKKAEKFEDFYM
ncbi:ABC transporter ATP-binding protein [Fervidicoccus fontis]|uniref:Oligopeptide ABC transporter, ATP binding protein n=1 Tax=Fervidicoccus fontis (strain DSM 19380 / JCM 18336 / VKM B-2539 / Kam940) TaxID=1163730 RepID=I0A000_FERFK|nr:ABC transporter ATP-binding protein [Fervidicoccus fontis]AFH42307.1 oligopeptide ABC transporter, ATP binding protein [Fervidicoccus fontis Kam940]